MTSKLDTAGLVARLRTVSNMINMGEKIGWGEETALMDQAATALEALTQAAAPDMEPFGYWCECKGADPALLRKPAYIPPTDALHTTTPLYTVSQLSAMQERVEKAERERDEAIGINKELVRHARSEGMSYREDEFGAPYFHNARAEAAEARVAEMEARLATICKVQSDNYGDATATHVALIKPCDEARAALAHKGEGR